MKFVIQRVTHAEIDVDKKPFGSIGKGFVVLVGISDSDDEKIADRMLDKTIKLRIFEDENGKTNLSLADVGGELMLVSQFTLYANCKKGNRPSFIEAGSPDEASRLYDYIVAECEKRVPKVARGKFGHDMDIELSNAGPFTIVLDSKEIF